MPQTLGVRLREAREAAGLSKTKAAELLGATRQQIMQWERDVYTPRPDRLRAMETLYRLETGSLSPPPVAEEGDVLALRQAIDAAGLAMQALTQALDALVRLEQRASGPGGSGAGHAKLIAQRPTCDPR